MPSRMTKRKSMAIFWSALMATASAQAPPPAGPALLMDGHVHITNRVYWEGIDPWKAQEVGLFDYARAWEGGANVVIENLGSYGYEDYDGTVKQVGRLLETFHRTLEAHRDKMEL